MVTTAYVLGAQFDWRRGLSEGIGRARGFYGVLAASVGLALVVALANISVIDMLVAASVIGGFGTPIGLVLLVRLARDPQVMGSKPISRRLAIAGGPSLSLLVASACSSSSGQPWARSDIDRKCSRIRVEPGKTRDSQVSGAVDVDVTADGRGDGG